MTTHAETRIVPYSPQQMFDLVADVDRYPEFLPWCIGARITKRDGNVMLGDLIIGYKLIRERFSSEVTLDPPHRIQVKYLHGPLSYLSNHWTFTPTEDGGCRVDFFIDFEFRTAILQKLMSLFFHEAVRRMVGAFEARARDLYGKPDLVTPPHAKAAAGGTR